MSARPAGLGPSLLCHDLPAALKSDRTCVIWSNENRQRRELAQHLTSHSSWTSGAASVTRRSLDAFESLQRSPSTRLSVRPVSSVGIIVHLLNPRPSIRGTNEAPGDYAVTRPALRGQELP